MGPNTVEEFTINNKTDTETLLSNFKRIKRTISLLSLCLCVTKMISHQPRDNQFSFSNPTLKPEDDEDDRNGVEYSTWAQKIKGQQNHFGKPRNVKLGAWTRRTATEDKEEFKWLVKREEENESGTPSPELWKKNGTESPTIRSAGSSPVRNHGYNHITHGSRAQTIAGYRQEMLDMVRGMPETAYELSLRDIVESPKITTPLQSTAEENLEGGMDRKKKNKKKGKKEKKLERRISRSESIDMGGLFLNMFIPRIPNVFGGKKSSRNVAEAGAKVSPKPMLSGDGEKSTDREWWSSSNGSGGSSSSGRSSGRSSGKLSGCYSFLRTR